MARIGDAILYQNRLVTFTGRVLRKIERDFRRDRLRGVAAGALNSVILLLVRRREFVFLSRLTNLEPPRYRQLKCAEYRMMVLEDIEKIEFIDRKKRKKLRKYFDEGCQGWLSCVDGSICGFHFSSFKSIRESETGIEIKVLPGQVYQFDGMIDPRERGKTLAVSHLIRFLADMRALGLKEAFCFVDRGNRSSERLHKRMGFKPFAIYREYRICGVVLKRWSGFGPAS